jgi:hypothetical protein
MDFLSLLPEDAVEVDDRRGAPRGNGFAEFLLFSGTVIMTGVKSAVVAVDALGAP